MSLPNWTQRSQKWRKDCSAKTGKRTRGKYPTIRLLGVKAADLHREENIEAKEQLSLLPNEEADWQSASRWENALSAADKLREKYGDSAVSLARGMKGNFRERTHEAMVIDPKKKSEQ